MKAADIAAVAEAVEVKMQSMELMVQTHGTTSIVRSGLDWGLMDEPRPRHHCV